MDVFYKVKRPALFICAILFSLHAGAQYKFFQLALDKGLSDARVSCAVQDHYGYMWFGTPNGLNRFDAYSIKTFFADSAATGLTSNNIVCLYSDKSGTLWVGTSSGLVKYNFGTQRFDRYPSSEMIDKVRINCITEDAAGNLYAGTQNGLLFLDRLTGKWKNISAEFKLAERFVAIRGLLFFDEHTLFATTENKGFYKIDTRKRTLSAINYKTEFSDTCCLFMIGMQKMSDSIMLVGTLSYGLQRFNVLTNQFSTVAGDLRKSDTILFNTTTQIIKDHAGRFWTANYYFRLAEYFPAENRVVPVKRESENPYGFDGNTATCVYEDRQHNIWIGTAAKGAYRFNPNRDPVKFFSESDVEPHALNRGHILSLVSLGTNLVMAGRDGGPSFYNWQKNEFINFKGSAKELYDKPLELVQCGLMDKAGIVWMGTNRLGLMRYDTLLKTFRTWSRQTKNDSLQEDGITRMIELPGDSIMFLGWNRVVTFNTGNFKHVSFRNSNLPLYLLEKVTDIVYSADRKKIFLITSYGKIFSYNPASHECREEINLVKGLPKNIIFSLASVDRYNRIWLATNEGAFCLQEGHDPLKYTFSKSVSLSAEIKNLIVYNDEVWLTNNRTVARLNMRSGKLLYLGERTGFRGVQLSPASLTLSARNTILIGSNRGFYEIDPAEVTSSNSSNPVFITAFRVFDKPITTTSDVSMLSEIDLDYDENFFSFDFSSFDFSGAGDVEYSYMVQGFDKDWQYPKTRTGSYTNVPGGNYTLLLRSRIPGGEWNAEGRSIIIRVGKAFWQTWWFFFLCFLAIAALMYFIYRTRIKQTRKELKLKSEYEIRLNELENSALRTQMNPHFIFNSLNTINSFINRNEAIKANQYISTFSRLIRLILDHSREKKILLQDELEVVELYILLERIRFDNKFDYHLTIHPGADPGNLEIPPLIIQPFVENAILHGLLPAGAGGVLNVLIKTDEKKLICMIDDNGVGRKAAAAQKQLGPAKRKSHGLGITIKRIELFNREHGITDGVTVVDKFNSEGRATGTTVKIVLAEEECF